MMNQLFIATLCANMAGPSGMCDKTLDAANRQIGFHDKVEQAESVATENGKKTVGSGVVNAIAYGAVGVQVGMGKSAAMNFKGGSLCDKIILTGAKTKGSLGLGWNF